MFAVLPRPPTRLLVAQTTPTSITLAWFTDTVAPVSFTIQYRPSRRTPADDRWMTVNDIATIEHTVTGLQSFTEYEMRVVAVGEAGNSEPSDMVEVRTLKTSPGNCLVVVLMTNILACLEMTGKPLICFDAFLFCYFGSILFCYTSVWSWTTAWSISLSILS